MKVILDKRFYGHCPGLDRSLSFANALLNKSSSENKVIYYDVPLTHNVDATEKLDKKGMKKIDLTDVEDGENNYFLVSAHGASTAKIDDLSKKNYIVQDATCPIVNKLQRQVVADYKAGYLVIIFGKVGHPEIEGVNGSINHSAIVIKSFEEAKELELDKATSIACQTTFSDEEFDQIVEYLRKKFSAIEIVVRNTVCPIVKRRVHDIVTYAKEKQVDMVVVVGSTTSSNTKLLAKKVHEVRQTIMLDNAADLHKEDFLGAKSVLIVSGTSAPPEIVEEVADKIKTF
ncbi:MAG TPA: 4-hydroxy-3-methylbut-2-enyl diphosphate reductase [bacterium]|nr:4-hydroxy-3-methylbut-2-enyl diphosphate reductase [bacterium]